MIKEKRRAELHVLHVLDHLMPSSGVASVVMTLIKGLPQVKQDVAVYGRCEKSLENIITANGGRVCKLPDITQSLGRPFKQAYSKLLREQQYTVVHGHLLNSAFIYLREAKRFGVKKRVIHSHSARSANTLLKRVRNNILKMGIPLWANIFVSGTELAARNAFGKRSAHIVKYGVDVDKFKYDADVRKTVRNELGINDSCVCIGSIARFSPEKNHKFMFSILEEISDCVGVFAGGGMLPGSVKVPKNAKVLKEYGDVSRLYQAMDVFILPSFFEGFPVSVIEAQCAGLPCIVSDKVTHEVVCGESVEFLPIGNPMLWADKIVNIAKKQRRDGSSAVVAAGLDAGDMAYNIKKLWESGGNRDDN